MKLTSLSELASLLPESERKTIPANEKKSHDGKGKSLKLFLDTKGRKGKAVTIISGLQHNPATMEELAKTLKQQCGAGGTVKNGDIELQGDQRERAAEILRAMNYVVKII